MVYCESADSLGINDGLCDSVVLATEKEKRERAENALRSAVSAIGDEAFLGTLQMISNELIAPNGRRSPRSATCQRRERERKRIRELGKYEIVEAN